MKKQVNMGQSKKQNKLKKIQAERNGDVEITIQKIQNSSKFKKKAHISNELRSGKG